MSAVPRQATPQAAATMPTAQPQSRRRTRRRRDWWVYGCYAVLALFLLWVLVPILQVALNSFKTENDIFTSKPRVTFHPTLSNYHTVFGQLAFLHYLLNSTIVAVGTTVLSLVVGVPAAYALARLPVPGREWWAGGILFTRMAPAVALVVPIFVIFDRLQLLGTYWALILADTTFNLPIVIWLMRGFFEEVPVELEEAAVVDGTSRFGAFTRVALPLVTPGLAASAVLCLLFSWNEFLFALVLSNSQTQTVPIGVAGFVGTVSIDWGGSSAAAVIAMIPVFVLGLLAQRFLVRGLTLGAVKG
jgi:multiple sugar transport system permease protein